MSNPRIEWRRVGFLVLSPRAYFTHSLFWTGMGPRRIEALMPVRQWAYRHLVYPSRAARKVLG